MKEIAYRPEIDGLRAIAVLSVVLYHLNHRLLPGGFIGVDVFFVISGFLITSIIIRQLEAGEFSLIAFYQRRIARIYPAFLVMAIVTLLGAGFVYSPQDFASAGANFSAAMLSVINLKLMNQGGYFELSADAQPFLHCWSLSLEEQFYFIFPFLLILVYKKWKNQLPRLLLISALLSFSLCIWLTSKSPKWAFFMLPSRAWELMLGALLASVSKSWPASLIRFQSTINAIRGAGLAAILVGVYTIEEGPKFPGFLAVVPAVGAFLVMIPGGDYKFIVDQILGATPLVIIGKLSYSMYLWHWPIFSLVDYQMYAESDVSRTVLKLGMTAVTTIVSHFLIEKPSRRFLNQVVNVRIAYMFLTAAVVVLVPIGTEIRRVNYINAEAQNISKGGLHFSGRVAEPRVILMGDSNGSMYGKLIKSVCEDLGWQLNVISVAAGDPLPGMNGVRSVLWDNSLAVVRTIKPDILVIAFNWREKLRSNPGRIDDAIQALSPYVKRIVIVNQPPTLPENASRDEIRKGARPPFFEESERRQERLSKNEFLKRKAGGKVTFIDVARDFENLDGSVRFSDEKGRQLYHDRTHLSGNGGELVRAKFRLAFEAGFESDP